MRINNNISAVNTLNQLQSSDNAMSKSLEKLSSGLRINRAADDAAGLAISEKMRNQIKGLNQARTNAQDGVSLIQTAEGALNETHSILSRMRELTVQASNDTVTSDDREQIQKELNLLIDEVDRISTDTEFNTKKLLNGDASGTAKKASGFNEKGQVVDSVKATASAEAGTYKLKFSNKAAGIAMGTITRTSTGIEGEYLSNVGGKAMGADGGSGQNLSSSLTGSGTNNFYGSAVKAGTFFINDKEIKIEDGDTMYKVLNKINNSGSGVGATINSANQLELFADQDVASNIKLANGTSDFLTVAGINLSGAFTNVPGSANDDNLLTGATAGTVRLTNLQPQSGTDTTGTMVGLAASDVVTITGKVSGQVKTSSFTVGTSTVQDLLTNISNTFGGATATVERQRATKPADGTYENDFSENSTMSDVYKNIDATGTIKINGVNINVDTSETLQTFLNDVNAQTSNTGVTAALDRDSKTIVFSSANNIRMDITSTAGNVGSMLGITNQAGASVSTNDENKIVIKGQDGASNAVTELKISATDSTGTTQRSAFNSIMTLDQMQVARDKGDYLGVAQLNIEPSDTISQKYAVAVKKESVNTDLIQGVSVSIGKDIDEGKDIRDKATVTVGQVDGSVNLQIGANKGQTTAISIEDMGAVSLGLRSASGSKISITTREDAQNALDKIDKAIQKVSTQRSKLGAFQNRLEHTITNLGVSSENLTASESRIRDLDMASEMASFTKNQILQQAGTSMMAQANQRPQGVLKLLG